MSNRIDLLNQGMLGKIGEKISDATGTTKISLASTAARKKVPASLTAAAPGGHWRKRDRRSPTGNDATLMVSRNDAESILIRPGDDIDPKMTLADLGQIASNSLFDAVCLPERTQSRGGHAQTDLPC